MQRGFVPARLYALRLAMYNSASRPYRVCSETQ